MPDADAGERSEFALRHAGLLVYRTAWGALFVATLVMPVLAAIQLVGLAAPAAGSAATPLLPFRLEAWLFYSLNLIPAAFHATASIRARLGLA